MVRVPLRAVPGPSELKVKWRGGEPEEEEEEEEEDEEAGEVTRRGRSEARVVAAPDGTYQCRPGTEEAAVEVRREGVDVWRLSTERFGERPSGTGET